MLSGLHFKLRYFPLLEEGFLPLHFIFYQSLKFQCVCKGGVRMEIYLGVGCLFSKKDGRWKAKWFSAEAQGQPHPKKGSESLDPSATRQGPACRPTPRMSCLSDCARPTFQCNVLETRVVDQRNTSTPLIRGELMRAAALEKPQITGSKAAGSTERRQWRTVKNSHVQNQARYQENQSNRRNDK